MIIHVPRKILHAAISDLVKFRDVYLERDDKPTMVRVEADTEFGFNLSIVNITDGVYIRRQMKTKLEAQSKGVNLMSYNINRWEQLRCDKLQIPAIATGNLTRKWLTEFDVQLDLHAEDSRIKGQYYLDPSLFVEQRQPSITEGVFKISSIYLRGEGSGHCFYDQLLPILKQSTGEYEAVIYWVDDALITHLLVKDGKIADDAISVPLLLATIADYERLKHDINFFTDHYEIPTRLADRLADFANRIKGL